MAMFAITKKIITDIAGSAVYLTRWSLWLPGRYSIKLHKITRADDDRCVHDHPWWMLRIILWGGYEEQVQQVEGHIDCDDTDTVVNLPHTCLPWRPWAPWRVYYCPITFRHRITRLLRGSSWTLVICGAPSRSWGFYTRTGWCPWQKFVQLAKSARVLWCNDSTSVSFPDTQPPTAEA